MQRIKEELQDIARELATYAAIVSDSETHNLVTQLASRIREASSLITYSDREEFAKQQALGAYEAFTDLISEGVFK